MSLFFIPYLFFLKLMPADKYYIFSAMLKIYFTEIFYPYSNVGSVGYQVWDCPLAKPAVFMYGLTIHLPISNQPWSVWYTCFSPLCLILLSMASHCNNSSHFSICINAISLKSNLQHHVEQVFRLTPPTHLRVLTGHMFRLFVPYPAHHPTHSKDSVFR